MAETQHDLDEMETTYAAVVGARLRALRRQKRLSLQAVEELSEQEFKASVLGAYERGERTISVPRLQRLAHLYDVPVDQLLPAEMQLANGAAGALDGANRPARSVKVRIDLLKLKSTAGSEAAALQRYLQTIQMERGDFNGRVITIRSDDLRVISATLGLTREQMMSWLEEINVIES